VLITYIDELTARYQVSTSLNYVNYDENVHFFIIIFNLRRKADRQSHLHVEDTNARMFYMFRPKVERQIPLVMLTMHMFP